MDSTQLFALMSFEQMPIDHSLCVSFVTGCCALKGNNDDTDRRLHF